MQIRCLARRTLESTQQATRPARLVKPDVDRDASPTCTCRETARSHAPRSDTCTDTTPPRPRPAHSEAPRSAPGNPAAPEPADEGHRAGGDRQAPTARSRESPPPRKHQPASSASPHRFIRGPAGFSRSEHRSAKPVDKHATLGAGRAVDSPIDPPPWGVVAGRFGARSSVRRNRRGRRSALASACVDEAAIIGCRKPMKRSY